MSRIRKTIRICARILTEKFNLNLASRLFTLQYCLGDGGLIVVKKMIFNGLLAVSILTYSGCAGRNRSSQLSNLALGTDRSIVVERFGSPNQQIRRGDSDHWIYRFYKGQDEYYRVLVFRSSKLVFVSEEDRVLDRKNIDLLNELYRVRFSNPPE